MNRDAARMPELDSPQRMPGRIWIGAALGAIAIHVGCIVLALAYAQPEDDAEALGAPAIEVSIERTAPRLEATDLPPGPEAEATAASPAIVEQKAVIEKTELPTAVPTDTEDPDRLVAPDKAKTPKDEPDVAAVQANPSQMSVATEATAVPNAEAVRESIRSLALALGTGDSDQRTRATWQKELAAHFDKHKRYPADRSSRHAEIVVSFVLDRTGHILSTKVVQGSGDASFDEAALAMLRRSDPVPPPPPLVADEGLSFTLPVIFRVKGRN